MVYQGYLYRGGIKCLTIRQWLVAKCLLQRYMQGIYRFTYGNHLLILNACYFFRFLRIIKFHFKKAASVSIQHNTLRGWNYDPTPNCMLRI